VYGVKLVRIGGGGIAEALTTGVKFIIGGGGSAEE
jgi:hypothetical protein